MQVILQGNDGAVMFNPMTGAPIFESEYRIVETPDGATVYEFGDCGIPAAYRKSSQQPTEIKEDATMRTQQPLRVIRFNNHKQGVNATEKQVAGNSPECLAKVPHKTE